ncbi:hypothetical protein C7U63_21700 [Aeromonas veronii]|uniref:hypothetical protein n=1 Tax=Aeromonas veronii TaxID=654 RepID=UPI000E569D91|nr:hypothetical protein [Aeromonas veronii]AXV22303.1 hypothetical protein C7U63_21700 [Aeromonas veronii]
MERISLHSLIQRTMCMLGFSLESMADRVSALIWLGNNIGEQWPYYIDDSTIGFNDWKFIRDADSGEIVFSNMQVPAISKHELVEVFQDDFSANNNTTME